MHATGDLQCTLAADINPSYSLAPSFEMAATLQGVVQAAFARSRLFA